MMNRCPSSPPVSGNQSAHVIRPRKRAEEQQVDVVGHTFAKRALNARFGAIYAMPLVGEPLPCRCRGVESEAQSVAFREV